MKKFVTFLSLTTLGVGSLIYIMKKRKRRRLLDEDKPVTYNKVSKDFGGMVPDPLYKYLKTLGKDKRIKEGYELWDYPKVLEFSKSVSQSLNNDILIVLGIEKSLSTELGKYVFLMYSKEGYPDSLILVTHEDSGQLAYHSSVDFSILH